MKKVLIITNSLEKNIECVLSELTQRGQEYIVLTTNNLLDQNPGIYLRTNQDSFLILNGQKIEMEQIKSVWYRRPQKIEVSEKLPREQRLFIGDEFRTALWSLYTTLPVYWMNHPLNSHYLLEHNKLYQLKLAAEVGIKIPDTVITNIPETLLQFCSKHGGSVAIKVLRSRIFQETHTTWGIYTTRVSYEYLSQHVNDILLAPLIAQEYIKKLIELRVTVVEQQIFACAIHSQDSEKTKDDWRRYDFKNVKHEPYKMPSEIEDKIRLFMIRCGIVYGAIDMIITPNHNHVFLEVNPSGQYTWIEALTEIPITEAIVDALINPPSVM